MLDEIIQHTTDLLALVELANLTIVKYNTNVERHFGIGSDTFIGKFLYELVSKKVPREKTQEIIDALEKNYFYIDNTTDPENHIFLNQIQCGGKKCCLVRISSQKQNYAMQQYEHLFQKNLAGVYKADINGDLLSCNQAFASILGYDHPDELIGKNTASFYREPELRKKYIEQLLANPVLMNFELEIIKKDGKIAGCLENSYLEKMGDKPGVISGTLLDVSEKHEFEQALQESEARFKVISSVSNEGVVLSDRGVVIDCNDQFARLLGYVGGVDVIGREIAEFINPADIRRIRTSIEISSSNRTEIRSVNKTGKVIFLEITGSFLPYRGKQTLVLVINDITNRKKVELALQQSAVSFRRLLENSPNGVVILTEDKIKYLNHAACALLGIEDEDELYDKNFLPYVASENRKEIKQDLRDIRDGLEIDYKEVPIKRKNGEFIDVGIRSVLTAYENKPSVQITLDNVSARNQLVQEQIRMRLIEDINTALKAEINEHKTTQKKLEDQQREAIEQKAKLESIFNSTENLMMWTIDKDYKMTAMNRNFVEWMNHFFDEKLGLGDNIMQVLQRHLDEDFYQGQLLAFNNGFKGRPQQFEFALKNTRNETTWLQAFLNPVIVEGKMDELSCLLYDITERKEFDKKIRDSLKEKEVLLQEVHHRVKNNLQVISSILNLQSSYVNDEKTIEVLKESQQRIKSMSFLHETIYRTADFSKLEFTDYIRAITNNLMQSYRKVETRVDFVDKMDTVYLSLDQSIPCGLIVNELVSNALKHAFAGKKEGKITILLKEKDDNITLHIKDNGVGLPENFGYEKSNSLGIQLVYALLEQLDAEIKIDNTKGTAFLIEFKRK